MTEILVNYFRLLLNYLCLPQNDKIDALFSLFFKFSWMKSKTGDKIYLPNFALSHFLKFFFSYTTIIKKKLRADVISCAKAFWFDIPIHLYGVYESWLKKFKFIFFIYNDYNKIKIL